MKLARAVPPKHRRRAPRLPLELTRALSLCRYWRTRRGRRVLIGLADMFYLDEPITPDVVRARLQQLGFNEEARDPHILAHVARFMARRLTDEEVEGKRKPGWVSSWRK